MNHAKEELVTEHVLQRKWRYYLVSWEVSVSKCHFNGNQILHNFYFSAGKNVKTKEELIPEAAQTVWKIIFPFLQVSFS